MIFGLFTLFVALCISAVAEFYSIIGLTAIFAAEPIPVIIMGVALGVGKITAAVWLKVNWHRAGLTYKMYLVPAVAFLMVLTSMGIFGFLSKAHSDQSLVGGDVQAKIAIYDEKIKTAKENIEANRRQLKQMDEAVDQVMARSQDEKGADKANAIRRSQQRDRSALAKDIEANQKLIATINDEAAPIRAEVRKVEAEVGPIKYIAALIYGDSTDTNLLEASVRWVIILIVAVFDPLALVLIVAAQQSLRWAKEEKFQQEEQDSYSAKENITVDTTETLSPAPPAEVIPEAVVETTADVVPEPPKSMLEQHPYLGTGFAHFKNLTPMVYKPEVVAAVVAEEVQDLPAEIIEPVPVVEAETIAPDEVEAIEPIAVAETTPTASIPYYKIISDDYMEVEGKMIHKRVLSDLYPEVASDIDRKKLAEQLAPQADNRLPIKEPTRATFGVDFPKDPIKGELFLHVAKLPSVLYKFNGSKWIAVDKSATDSYTYNEDYLQYLIEKVNLGHFSLDDLTNSEQAQIEEYLKKHA